MSKGSRQRPVEDQQKFWDNWDRIFGNKDKQPEEKKKEEPKREDNS